VRGGEDEVVELVDFFARWVGGGVPPLPSPP
jgi:hypothetical protein